MGSSGHCVRGVIRFKQNAWLTLHSEHLSSTLNPISRMYNIQHESTSEAAVQTIPIGHEHGITDHVSEWLEKGQRNELSADDLAAILQVPAAFRRVAILSD
jgi:hypothetical protein